MYCKYPLCFELLPLWFDLFIQLIALQDGQVRHRPWRFWELVSHVQKQIPLVVKPLSCMPRSTVEIEINNVRPYNNDLDQSFGLKQIQKKWRKNFCFSVLVVRLSKAGEDKMVAAKQRWLSCLGPGSSFLTTSFGLAASRGPVGNKSRFVSQVVSIFCLRCQL